MQLISSGINATIFVNLRILVLKESLLAIAKANNNHNSKKENHITDA